MKTDGIPKGTIVAAASGFEFSAFVDEHYWRLDGHDLDRIVTNLSKRIRSAAPVLQPGIDCHADRIGLTDLEYAYSSNFWMHWHRSPIIAVIEKKGWGLRRVHAEMLSMLRALISLDPEKLAEFDVVEPLEYVRQIEEKRLAAADVLASELERLGRGEIAGHMLRYGIYLGMKLVQEHPPCEDFSFRILNEIGANDPLTRPAYPTRPDLTTLES